MMGVWVLQQAAVSRGEGIRSRTRGPGGIGGGGGGSGGGEGRYGEGMGGGWMPPAFRELLRAKTSLEIAQPDTVVTVKDDSGWLRYLLPGKGTMREELGQGGPAVVESSWKKDRLVTERKMDTGERYREEYRLERKNGRLLLDIEFSTPRMQKSLKMRRTYERQDRKMGG